MLKSYTESCLLSAHNIALNFNTHTKHTHKHTFRARELCESRGGRPGLPSLINLRFLSTLHHQLTHRVFTQIANAIQIVSVFQYNCEWRVHLRHLAVAQSREKQPRAPRADAGVSLHDKSSHVPQV